MAVYMGAVMAISKLGMYSNKRVNIAIFAGAVLAFALALWLVRSEETVADLA